MTEISPENILEHFSKDYKYQKFLAKKISPKKCDDLIQEAYLVLHRRLVEKNRTFEHFNITADRMYFFMTMTNIVRDDYKKKKYEHESLDIVKDIAVEEDDETFIENKIIFELKYKKMNEILDDIHWYRKKLFLLYLTSGKSMRQIAEETTISLSSIFLTIKGVKELLKEEL